MCKKDTFRFVLIIVIAIMTAISASAQSNLNSYDFNITVRGQGPDIILIPGLSSPAAVWDSTVQELMKSYTCHVLSLPGFAGVEAIETDDSYLPEMANQIVKYIEDKQLDEPILMGHSLGGFLSLYIASENPGLVSRIVSVDGVPFLPAMINPAATEQTGKMMVQQMAQQMRSLEGENRRMMHKNVISTMVTDPDKQKLAVEWSMNSDMETINQAMNNLYTTDLRDDISSIEVPILVLGAWKGYENYGVTKEMTLQMLRDQYKEAENVHIKVSDSGKHFLMWDDPEFVMRSFRSFMANPNS